MADIEIRVSAEDDTGDALESAAAGIEHLQQSSETAASSFQTFADAAASGAREVEHGMAMMTRLDLVQITLEMSTDRVSQAQEKYNEALLKYGPSSQQAEQAAYNLQRAHDSLEKANLRAELSLGLVMASSLQMAATAIPAAITALEGLTAAEGAAALGAGILEVTLTAGAAAIGIVAGISAVSMAIQGVGSAAESAAGSVESLTAAERENSDQAAAASVQQHAASMQLTEEETAAAKANDQDYFASRIAGYKADLDAKQAALDAATGADAIALGKQLDAAKKVAAEIEATPFITGGTISADNPHVAALNTAKAAVADLERQFQALVLPADKAKQFADAISKDADEMKRLGDIAAKSGGDSAGAMEAAAKRTDSAWGTALAGVGLTMDKLSTSILQSASMAGGELGRLADQVLAVRSAEEATEVSVLSHSEALRKQATITREKGETTEEFKKRLLDMGFAEADVNAKVQDTTKSFTLQTEATRAASQQAANYTAGGGGGGPIASTIDSLDHPLRAGRQVIQQGHGSGMSGDEETLQAYLHAHPAAGNDPTVQQAMRAIKQGHAFDPDNPGGVPANIKKSLPMIFAADGFEGRVDAPTLFMAGEAGPENVSIRNKRQGTTTGATTVHVHLSPGEGTPEGVERGVIRGLALSRLRQGMGRNY